MNPARWLCSTLILITGTAVPPASSTPQTELTALLTQPQGNVTIVEAAAPSTTRGTLPVPRRAQDFQVMRAGDEVRLPAGARLGLVCSTDRWVEIRGGRNQRLTADLCRSGKPLPPGTYDQLSPAAGLLRSVKRARVLERGTRGTEEDFAIPILVSPRNTAVLDPRPTILWTPVSEATDYELELTGPKPFKLHLDASQVDCTARWGDLTVCKLPYPEKEQDLPPGTISFLTVGACRGLAAPLREESKPNRVQRLASDKAEAVRAQVASLQALPLGEAARQLLLADLYIREGLLSDAIPAYRSALAGQDLPEARVMLGNLDLEIGLLRPAARIYQEILDNNPTTLVQAAAELGLGRAEYTRGSFERAEYHFRKARDLFNSLGSKEEAGVAEQGMKEAAEKKPK